MIGSDQLSRFSRQFQDRCGLRSTQRCAKRGRRRTRGSRNDRGSPPRLWVATSGTRLDRDRPTRQTAWPGEDPAEPVEETIIADRAEDFVQFVLHQVAEREQAEEEFFRTLDQRTGEVS